MKKTLVIAALALAATPALASKARLNSLNNAAHLQDTQDIFKNASKVTQHGEWLTFELGSTAATTANNTEPHAEGGFVRSMGDASYGFYLGHRNIFSGAATAPGVIGTVNSVGFGARQATYLADENPVDLFYGAKAGELAWGVGLHYSNSDKKTTKQKQSSTALNVGVSANNWDLGVDLGLVNTYKNETVGAEVDFKGTTGIALNGTYTMDTMTFSGSYGMNGGKEEAGSPSATAHDISNTVMQVGVVNSHKTEGADFFYGADYVMTTSKDAVAAGDNKTERTTLPVFAGIEANANSWMVLRASVRQNFLLGSEKDTTAAANDNDGNADTIENDTSVGAGVGLKFGKLLIDGTLEAANSNTAALNGNSMLANAAVTYLF